MYSERHIGRFFRSESKSVRLISHLGEWRSVVVHNVVSHGLIILITFYQRCHLVHISTAVIQRRITRQQTAESFLFISECFTFKLCIESWELAISHAACWRLPLKSTGNTLPGLAAPRQRPSMLVHACAWPGLVALALCLSTCQRLCLTVGRPDPWNPPPAFPLSSL